MASTAMHIAIADQLLQKIPNKNKTHKIILNNKWAYTLGSIFPDLPFFENFWSRVAFFFIKKPYPGSRWGYVTHWRRPFLFAFNLSQIEQDDINALILGYLTHVYVDIAVHTSIEPLINENILPSQYPVSIHETIENYHSVMWHRKYKGIDDLGSEYIKNLIKVTPDDEKVPFIFKIDIFKSMDRAFGQIPLNKTFNNWIKGILTYANFMSTPAGKVSISKTEETVSENSWIEKIDFYKIYDEAFDKLSVIFSEFEEYICKDSEEQQSLREEFFKKILPFKNLVYG